MADSSFLSSLNLAGFVKTGSSILDFIIIGGIILLALLIIGGIFWFFYARRKWNLKVEFKLPRTVKYNKSVDDPEFDINSIQGALSSEWGKGYFNVRKGVVFLKRKGKRKIFMKPFRINKFLQGDTLTVVQVGAEEYIPVMPENFMIFTDDENNEKVTVLDLKTDSSESKAWGEYFEKTALKTYSITDMLTSLLSNPIFLVGLVIFMWGIQLLLLYNRLGK